MVRSILNAFRFLTAFPIGGARGAFVDTTDTGVEGGEAAACRVNWQEELSRAMAFFPVIGAIQGLILAAFYLLLLKLLPVAIVSALLIVVLVFSSNALHLDGLADTLDGLSGGKDRTDILRIMRDSHIGPSGVIGIVLVIVVKFFAIASLPPERAAALIVLFPLMGRYAMVPMAVLAPYARDEEGVGAAFASNSKSTFITATLITLVLSLLLVGVKALIILFALLVFVYFLTAYFKRKLGGVTGDVFGFQSELAEVFTLLLAIVLFGSV